MQDKMTALMVIGAILKKPAIVIDENFKISMEDFSERFHKIVFSAIHNLVCSGAQTLDPIEIDNYLSTYDKQYKIFNDNNGFEYLNECILLADVNNIEYYYKKLKKLSLLRKLNSLGIDTSEIYDDSLIDITLKEQMNEKFESMSVDDIIDEIERKVIEVKQEFTQEEVPQIQAGKGLESLVESFKETPEMGLPLQSKILNTIVRGARLGKLYLRSAPTGFGKTRFAVADACGLSVPHIYNLETKRWNKTGFSEPTLIITTELSCDEVQSMIVAFVSGVEEWKILDGKYDKDEEKRIKTAIKHIESSPLWIVQLENFNIENIETTIKEYKIKHKVGYVFFDYLFTSMKLLAEINSQTKGSRLREDNVLYIFAERMKHLCNKLGVFMFTATQLNGDWKESKDADMNLLRGSKAIADKIDVGIIALPITKLDVAGLKPITQNGFFKEPNMCYHIYKVRRGKLSRVRLWIYVDFSTMRSQDIFLTNSEYELLPIEATNIEQILEDNALDIEQVEGLANEQSPFSF